MNIIGIFDNKPIDQAGLVSSQLLLKTNEMVIFMNIREVKSALFHTSKGSLTLDIKLFTICARKTDGSDDLVEAVISARMRHAITTAYRVKTEGIHFDDMLWFLEENCDFEGIDKKVEHIISK